MKIVYVTGSNGFIGGRIMDYLNDISGYEVYGIQQGSNRVIKNIIYSDYQNFSFLNKKIKDSCFVIHTAAFIPKKGEDNKFVQVINNGIANFIIKSFRGKKVEKFFYTSSINIYGINKKDLINTKEDSEIILDSYYSKSKYDSEVLFSNNFKSNYNLRISSPFGKGKKRKTLLEKSIVKALSGKKIFIYGKGDRKQDFIWVKDIARVIDILIKKNVPPGDYNLCSGQSLSVQELMLAIEEVMGKKINIVSIKKYEDFSVTISNSKLLMAIGANDNFFTPFKEALKEII